MGRLFDPPRQHGQLGPTFFFFFFFFISLLLNSIHIHIDLPLSHGFGLGRNGLKWARFAEWADTGVHVGQPILKIN